MTTWRSTLWALATAATVWPPWSAVRRSASLMPIALATTEGSVTASLWPPPGPLWTSFGASLASAVGAAVLVPPAPVVPDEPDAGAVEAAGAGDAASVEIGPRIAAPATPPRINAPAIFAFWLLVTRRTGC